MPLFYAKRLQNLKTPTLWEKNTPPTVQRIPLSLFRKFLCSKAQNVINIREKIKKLKIIMNINTT